MRAGPSSPALRKGKDDNMRPDGPADELCVGRMDHADTSTLLNAVIHVIMHLGRLYLLIVLQHHS